MTTWTSQELDKLPEKSNFRLRGLEMTRLETFCDAAFAFAVTLLVIAGDGIPQSYDELVLALKGVPAFAASFASIAWFWTAHRSWSRRFGLEDGVTTLLSLTLVFVMLVYVYPLKMVFSGFAYWVSNGWLPSEFTLNSPREMLGIFVVYGAGFAAQTGMIALLHLRALRVAELNLNEAERIRTRQEIAMSLALGVTGVASALWALLLPAGWGMFAGFFYMTLPVTMPVLAIRYTRKVEALAADSSSNSSTSIRPPESTADDQTGR